MTKSRSSRPHRAPWVVPYLDQAVVWLVSPRWPVCLCRFSSIERKAAYTSEARAATMAGSVAVAVFCRLSSVDRKASYTLEAHVAKMAGRGARGSGSVSDRPNRNSGARNPGSLRMTPRYSCSSAAPCFCRTSGRRAAAFCCLLLPLLPSCRRSGAPEPAADHI